MRSDDLSPVQLKAVRAGLAPLVGYLAKLRQRMFERGFEPDDELFTLVKQAHDATDRLSVELHYRACHGGVGKSPRRA